MSRDFVLTFLTLTLAACQAPRDVRPGTPPRSRAVEAQGHRGCRGLRPENTMAAFEHAIRLGVDVLELDLGMTKDGVLVVAHDPEVNPALCTGPVRGRLRDLTYEELRALDCGALRNPRFPEQQPVKGQPIPRLEQVLDLLARHRRLRANLEIKTFSIFPERAAATWPPKRFAAALVPLLVGRGLVGRVTVQSFDPKALQAVARLGRGIVLSALVDRRESMDTMLAATGAAILSPRHTELRPTDLPRLHARKIRVIPWTVNDPDRMRELIGWGVDGIITDRPDLLLRLLGR
jgi:glycerophosphoryl diester phosphodiesterase